jgi:hypothetical protein
VHYTKNLFTEIAMIARLLATSIVLLAASPAAIAYNVLKNGTFNGPPSSGTSGWNLSAQGAQWESYLGATAGGSLHLDADAAGTPVNAHADQCVDVHQWFALDVVLAAFNNAEGGGGTHTFKLDVYDGFDCTGNIVQTITTTDSGETVMGINNSTWKIYSKTGTQLLGSALSAKMNLDTNAPPGGISYYLLDDVQVIPPDEIFPDTFGDS